MKLRALLLALAPLTVHAQADIAHCSLPGELISEDAATDVVPVPGTGFDVSTVHVAELAGDDGEGKIYFTMKIDRQSAAATPQTRYMIEFTTKDGVARYVSYTPYPIAPIGSVLPGEDLMFVVGHYEETGFGLGSFNDGPADAASSAGADGQITIVAPNKLLGRIKAGDAITDIIATSRGYNLTGTFVVDSSDTPGTYQLRGNDSCKGKSADTKSTPVEDKTGTHFGGALAPGLLALLFGFAGLRRRRG